MNEKTRIHCNSCNSETWHEIKNETVTDRYDSLWGYAQKIEAAILSCNGCDLVTFRYTKHPFDFEEDEAPEVELYPERNFKKRSRKYVPMPHNISRLYKETITAHDANLVLLSAAGLRALLESIVVDKIDKSSYGRNIESKINALATKFEPGVIAVLHQFREMGNLAIHAQVESDRLDIHRALYVVESIMEYFYGIDNNANSFTKLKEINAKKKAKSP
jgi:hypothetical protein